MNEENKWDQIADADAVEGSIESAMKGEIMEMLKHLKIAWVPRPTEINAEMIIASGDVGIRVLFEICLRILDGK